MPTSYYDKFTSYNGKSTLYNVVPGTKCAGKDTPYIWNITYYSRKRTSYCDTGYNKALLA